jgi:hypothetical protein
VTWPYAVARVALTQDLSSNATRIKLVTVRAHKVRVAQRMSPESETVELGGLSAQRASAATPSGVFEPTRARRDIDRQYVRSVQTSSAAIAIPGPERLQPSRPSLLADSRRGLRGAPIAPAPQDDSSL